LISLKYSAPAKDIMEMERTVVDKCMMMVTYKSQRAEMQCFVFYGKALEKMGCEKDDYEQTNKL
jgi:hypothetical protein